MNQKQATDLWRMLNTFLSVVAIAITVAAMMRNPDGPAAAESPPPRQNGLNQATTIAGLSSTVAEQGSTIARLENTVEEQGSTIDQLENTAEEQGTEIRSLTGQLTAEQTGRQTPISVGTASRILFSDVRISRVPVPGVLLDQEGFRIAAPALLGPVIRFIAGQVQVTSTFTDEGLAGVRWIDGVEGIAGHMKIESNGALTTLGSAF